MFKNSKRWGMLSWLFVIVMISYFDRVNFSVSAPLIMKEFSINAALMGIIMSGFNIGYTLMNFTGGFLAEKYSSRKLMTIIVLLWSIMTVITGFGWSFVALLAIRIIFGMCEGPLVLINTKLVNRWMLPKERATASGLWLAAMPLGSLIGVVLSGLIVSTYGWRSVFYIFGVGGIVIAAFSWKILRDRPEDHPSISKKELDNIESSIMRQDGAAALTAPGSTLAEIVKNPLVWVICAVYFALLMFMWGNLNWLPTYFVQARGSTLLNSGIYAAIPFLGATLGPLVLGWLSDRGILLKTRSGWVCLSLFVMVPTVIYAVITPSLQISLTCFTIASFFAMASMAMMFTLIMEIFERANIAKISGFMLGSGSFAGIVAPSLVGFVLESTNSFNNAYYIFAAVALVGGMLSIILVKREGEFRRNKTKATMRLSEKVT